MFYKIIGVFCFLFIVGCTDGTNSEKAHTVLIEQASVAGVEDELLFDSINIADRFDYPVGPPDGKGYYNAQGFGANLHLGDDWNGIGGGNTDFGDTIYAIGNGYVFFAEDIEGGWGNVVRLIHQLPNGKQIESLYAHCDTLIVSVKEWVKRGDPIATIGTANGAYLAHLHLEIRDSVRMEIGGGYGSETEGYIDPTKFLKRNR